MTHIRRLHLRVTGVVQGVGFRPFVYGLAIRHALAGFVGNDNQGVFIEVEGDVQSLAHFQQALTDETPPLAHIDSVTVNVLAPRYESGFRITDSVAQVGATTLVSPDLCFCDDCLQELFDPTNRRYRYPFINCTNCGPRFTIIRDLPYDRSQTTMVNFPMCADCNAEYHDPLNRRFHAQPNACPVCGPQVTFTGKHTDPDPICAAQNALNAGQIIALKGLGGFHLACDATNDDAIQRLRQRKRREEKPFAVMVADLASAHKLAHISAEEAKLLTGRERPIVLLLKKAISAQVMGENNPYVGVMLPYTPLHALLLDGVSTPLVMTSGNYSGEPIITDNADALDKLADIADAFLLHDRDIHVPCDDSVVRIVSGKELPIRRSRGYAPFPVKLSVDVPPVLAVGGELKNTFCLTGDNYAFMSQHIGDMENLETLTAFDRAVTHIRALFRVEPQVVAHDMHPSYLSTRWARESGLPLITVQHHHAHIVGVMAEHRRNVNEQVIGFSFDGTGYGTDGAIWGGEVLLARYADFERVAHLNYVPLAGGDLSVKKPYRMALAHLWSAGLAWDNDLPCVIACPEVERRVLRQQFEKSINTVPTSSMGRLFDAVAALIGVRQEAYYEAQAAIELEGIAELCDDTPYHFHITEGRIDPKPVLEGIIAETRARVAPGKIAGHFHVAVADLIFRVAEQIRETTAASTVVLSGGVFQNVLLLRLIQTRLEKAKFELLTHRQVPPNDAGLALGQAMIAVQQIEKNNR